MRTDAQWRCALSVALVLMVLSGCSTTRNDSVTNSPMPTYSGESVVVMARSYHTGNKTESDFTRCIVNELRSGQNKLNIMRGEDFIDAMYPWFEPRTAPNDIGDMPRLIQNEKVAARMRETGVRYVVWLDGNTEMPGGGGSISCAAGAGAAGCFGFAWWENDSDYDAAVWDLDGQKEAGSLETKVNGTSYLPAIVIPIPLIARTRAKACDALAEQLQQFIRSGSAVPSVAEN
ncbi:MAG: hypothetical protein AAGA84_08800 [Pseudomonadota bacterium]